MIDITLRARAKINLTLDVKGKRDDGYHELEMVMQTVALYDRVYIKKIEKPGIRLKTNLEWLPVDAHNIAYQAASCIKERFGIEEGIFIELDKRIPVAAGLAGGSADCAAVLVGMNRLFGLGMTEKELMEIGGGLGSDVPYCILRGTALATGRGEIVTPLPPCPPYTVVLAKPPVSVSTASVYKNLKLDDIRRRPDTQNMCRAIQAADSAAIASGICNVLETVTVKMYPVLDEIKQALIGKGAAAALMSGSGPTVFGLFDNRERAQAAAVQLKTEMNLKDVFVTRIFNRR